MQPEDTEIIGLVFSPLTMEGYKETEFKNFGVVLVSICDVLKQISGYRCNLVSNPHPYLIISAFKTTSWKHLCWFEQTQEQRETNSKECFLGYSNVDDFDHIVQFVLKMMFEIIYF